MSFGKLYKKGVSYIGEYNPDDVSLAGLAIRAMLDEKCRRIHTTYEKKTAVNTKSITDTIDYHNRIYRGKDLTNRFKSGDLESDMAARVIRDVFIGDYFTLSLPNPKNTSQTLTITFRVAIFFPNGTSYMIGIVPDTSIIGSSTIQWNTTNTVTGAYKSSAIHTFLQSNDFRNSMTSMLNGSSFIVPTTSWYITKEIAADIMSGNGININGQVPNYVSASIYSAMCMSEVEVYGSRIWSSAGPDNANKYHGQLPLFKHNPSLIIPKDKPYYLRSVNSNNYVCCVDTYGQCVVIAPSTNEGCRPIIYIR